MGFLAFGIFLLLVGLALSVTPIGFLIWAGWICIALGAILIVAHLAIGPKRRPGAVRGDG